MTIQIPAEDRRGPRPGPPRPPPSGLPQTFPPGTRPVRLVADLGLKTEGPGLVEGTVHTVRARDVARVEVLGIEQVAGPERQAAVIVWYPPCFVASCDRVSSPFNASSATLALKSAEYRFRFQVPKSARHKGRA